MASVTVVERIALYDNSKKDEHGKECFTRMPWDLVTIETGVKGSPRTTFLESVNVHFPATTGDLKTTRTVYHGTQVVDGTRYYGFNDRMGTGGPNRGDKHAT